MDMEYTRTTICQLYINLEEDKIWARELAEVSQIIALTTKIDSLESKLQTTIALATSTNNAGGGGDGKTNGGGGANRPPVKEWRFKLDGKTKFVKGKRWTWCDQEHWANGEKVHGLYVRCHEEGEHDSWKKAADERYAQHKAKRRGQFQKDAPSDSKTVVNDITKKKLALSEKLRAALTTQARLSQDAFSRIWEECDRESGKD